jgi:hypothetical protein
MSHPTPKPSRAPGQYTKQNQFLIKVHTRIRRCSGRGRNNSRGSRATLARHRHRRRAGVARGWRGGDEEDAAANAAESSRDLERGARASRARADLESSKLAQRWTPTAVQSTPVNGSHSRCAYSCAADASVCPLPRPPPTPPPPGPRTPVPRTRVRTPPTATPATACADVSQRCTSMWSRLFDFGSFFLLPSAPRPVYFCDWRTLSVKGSPPSRTYRSSRRFVRALDSSPCARPFATTYALPSPPPHTLLSFALTYADDLSMRL